MNEPLQGIGLRRDVPIRHTFPSNVSVQEWIVENSEEKALHENAKALRDSLEEVLEAVIYGDRPSSEVRARAMQALRAAKGL